MRSILCAFALVVAAAVCAACENRPSECTACMCGRECCACEPLAEADAGP